MKEYKTWTKLGTVLVTGVSLILCSWILGHYWKRTHVQNETVKVTGLATKDFISDLIVWRGNFSRKATTLKEAYDGLKTDADIIKGYLLKKGVSDSEMVFSAVNIMKDFRYITNANGQSSSVFDGFSLSQSVQIESHDVDNIERISREITDLINMGVEFYSQFPEYYSTRLADIKLEMLAQASMDAKTRALQIAENAGARLGELRNASMGIFQITGQNSSEDYSWGGTFNTTSKSKTASVTVKLEYYLK